MTFCFARSWRCTFVVLLAFVSGACAAASRSPDPASPRANEPAYPIVLAATAERREQALAAWAALTTTRSQGTNATPVALTPATSAASVALELQSVTATISALPADSGGGALMLPLVEPAGDGAEAAQEATRESLRRFLRDAAGIVGAQLSELSLIEIQDKGDTRRAYYRQRPFAFPLRGGYGEIEIAFTPDRRIVALSSTAIPDTERLNRALNAPRTRLTAAEAVQQLAGRSVTYADAAGRSQTVIAPAAGELAARELVVYPLRPVAGDSGAAALELRLAWEIATSGATPQLLIYLDAVSGDTIAVAPGPVAQ